MNFVATARRCEGATPRVAGVEFHAAAHSQSDSVWTDNVCCFIKGCRKMIRVLPQRVVPHRRRVSVAASSVFVFFSFRV